VVNEMADEAEDKVVVDDEQAHVEEQPKELTLEEGVDDLKQRLAAAEARAKAAEEAKHKAELDAHAARGTVQETNLQLVSNAIDTLRQSNEIAKANYKAAMSAGDYDAAATYQEEMSGHAAKLLQLEQGKQVLEIIARYQSATSIFDDFNHHEQRAVQHERAKAGEAAA